MADFFVNSTLDVKSQIVGFGDQMGVEIFVVAPTTTITTTDATTIQVSWTDAGGAHTVAIVPGAGETINTTTGYSIGVYYPDGVVFADQAAATAYMGTVSGMIWIGA